MSLAELAENGRLVREAIQLSASSVHEIANSPTLQGVELIRTQLEQVEAHISSTFAHLDERDKNLTGAIQQRIVEHGDLIARETARIVEAMESYVQGGAEAMGRLASADRTARDRVRRARRDARRQGPRHDRGRDARGGRAGADARRADRDPVDARPRSTRSPWNA